MSTIEQDYAKTTSQLVMVPESYPALPLPSPRDVVKLATEEAEVLADIIEKQKLYNRLGGKKHVRVEGWCTLAAMRGCVPREVSNTPQEDGAYVAVVELVRMADGAVISRASAECGGPQEMLWQNRAPYARRSMAATRATSKSIRIPFAWVMVLGGYSGTPAEEMRDEEDEPQAERPAKASASPAPSEAATAPPAVVPFGRNKGKAWTELTSQQLHWYEGSGPDGCQDAGCNAAARVELDRRKAAKALPSAANDAREATRAAVGLTEKPVPVFTPGSVHKAEDVSFVGLGRSSYSDEDPPMPSELDIEFPIKGEPR